MRVWATVAVVAAIAACASLAVAQGDTAGGKSQQETQASASKTAESAAQPKPLTAPAAQPKDAATDQKAQPKQAADSSYPARVFRWWKGVIFDPDNTSNFFIMLFTAVLTVVAIEQRIILRKSLRENADAMEIARRGAEAASQSASVADQNLRISQRAYIEVKGVFIAVMKDSQHNDIRGDFIALFSVVTNAGATPAMEARVIGDYCIGPFGEPPTFGPPDFRHGTAVGRGAELQTQWCPIPIDRWREAFRREVSIFSRTRIEYRDAFGAEHVTEMITDSIVGVDPDRWLSGDLPPGHGLNHNFVSVEIT